MTQEEKVKQFRLNCGRIICYSVRERNNVLDALAAVGVKSYGSTQMDEMYISVSEDNYWFCSSIYKPSKDNILGEDFLKLPKE